MESGILKILSEELRETRNLVVETRKMAEAAGKSAEAAGKTAEAAIRTADAAVKRSDVAWELVVMTRNQIQEELRYMKLPWWKKLTGKAA